MVRQAVCRAVPYLERLTALRYYPVPVLLIDEGVFQDLCPHHPEYRKADPELERDLYEILSFLWAVGVSFHGTRQGLTWPSGLPAGKGREKLMMAAEWVIQSIEFSLLHDRLIPQRVVEGVRIPGLSDYPDAVRNLERVLWAIGETLRLTARRHPKQQLTRLPEHLGLDHSWKKPCLRPNLDSWRRRLAPEAFTRLQQCIDADGRWHLDNGHLAQAFQIGADVLFALIREWRVTSSRYAQTIAELRTYGFYLPPWEGNLPPSLLDLASRKGFPAEFWAPGLGKVFLCLDRIRRRAQTLAAENADQETALAQAIAPGWNAGVAREEAPPIQEEGAWHEKLLLSTIVHEHAQAINLEGVGGNTAAWSLYQMSARDSANRTVVAETLAEWAELEFWGNDPVMADMVSLHAASGLFPAWPYAGALRLEQTPAQDLIPVFRDLLASFRAGDEDALAVFGKAAEKPTGLPSGARQRRRRGPTTR